MRNAFSCIALIDHCLSKEIFLLMSRIGLAILLLNIYLVAI